MTKTTEETTAHDQEPQLTYEQARDELITVVNSLESGTENLDESMKLFQRGQYLAGLCEKYLSDARSVIATHQEDQAET